ncbi:hypothetical protein ScPMuIL_015793 [Solemya velum]
MKNSIFVMCICLVACEVLCQVRDRSVSRGCSFRVICTMEYIPPECRVPTWVWRNGRLCPGCPRNGCRSGERRPRGQSLSR